MLEKYVQDVIKLSADTITKTDEINKRLIKTIIITVVTSALCSFFFAATIIGVAYFYFTTDYNYGTNQTQINTTDSNQTIKGDK